MTFIVIMLAGVPALPDLPAPLGQLDKVLERPAQVTGTEQVVDLSLPKCDHPVPLNASRFVAGSAFALQQMIEWTREPGAQTVLTQPMLDEVGAGVRDGSFVETKACKALPKDVTAAPKLCPGKGANEAWLMVAGKPAALVRWSAATGKDKCLPKVTSVLFDAKGVARVKYDADFGGAAAGAMLGDKCQVSFTFDAAKEVFHAARRGCKGL